MDLKVPATAELENAILHVLRSAPDGLSVFEMYEQVCEHLGIPEEIKQLRKSDGKRYELPYRLSWARNHLKNNGLIENTEYLRWEARKD